MHECIWHIFSVKRNRCNYPYPWVITFFSKRYILASTETKIHTRKHCWFIETRKINLSVKLLACHFTFWHLVSWLTLYGIREHRINLNCMDKYQLTDLLFFIMSVAFSLYVNYSICYLFLRAVMHTHTSLYRHIFTDARDMAHFDVTDSKKKWSGREQQLQRWSWQDRSIRPHLLCSLSSSLFWFPFLSSLGLIKQFLREETMKEKPSKRGRRTIEGWRWSKL